jgi:hypothetical protein
MATTRKRRSAPGPVPVRFGEDERVMYRAIEAHAKAEKRSISGQIKYYAHLGMIAKDNPDLPLSMIEGILEAREEFRAGLAKPYRFGVIE